MIDIDERDIPIVQIDISSNTIIEIFTSASKADRYLKSQNKYGNASSISSCCKGRLQTSCGYKWKYLQDIDESQISDSFLLKKYQIINEILNIFKEE